MKGFPKVFNSKMDYLNAMEVFPEETKAALRSLFAGRFIWVLERELDDGDNGVSDETHYIAEQDGKKIQLIRIEDSNARYLRLGFTKDEILRLMF